MMGANFAARAGALHAARSRWGVVTLLKYCVSDSFTSLSTAANSRASSRPARTALKSLRRDWRQRAPRASERWRRATGKCPECQGTIHANHSPSNRSKSPLQFIVDASPSRPPTFAKPLRLRAPDLKSAQRHPLSAPPSPRSTPAPSPLLLAPHPPLPLTLLVICLQRHVRKGQQSVWRCLWRAHCDERRHR